MWRTRLDLLGALTSLLAVSLVASCAQQLGDIDRTQTNLIAKADLEGIWYMLDTVTDVPPTSRATFEGETSYRTEKIVWVIEEDLLLAYRSYPLVPGADDVDGLVDYSSPDYRESPIAAYPILEHVDVIREYNDQTGEQTNVIVENSSDRLWFDREYMRVDWSRNLVTNFDFISGWFYSPIEAGFFQDSERGLADSVYYEYDDDDTLVYFDTTRRLLLEPDLYGCIISSPWYAWDTQDCAPAEVEIVSSFARTEPRRDYEPLPYSDQNLSRFGFFRSERYVYDPERGVLESTRSRMANRINIWEQSYRHNPDGSFQTDGEERLIPIPLAERQVQTHPYYLSATYPDDPLILDAARDILAQWDAIAREGVGLLQGRSPADVPAVFVLCGNPVGEGEHPACGEAGFSPRPGDLRYSTLYWVESEQLEGPLGYGPVAADPETGEILSGRAYVYGSGINTYASYGVDVIRFLNGDLDPDDLIDAEHVRADVLRRADAATNLDRVSPDLRRIPLDSRRVRDRDRMQRRASRRRELHHFDRQAAMRRLESLRDQGISRPTESTDEIERALAARLGVGLNEIPDDVRDALDPSRWLSPTHLSELRRRRLSAMARGVDYAADMIDPHVIGLARSYAGRTDYEQIWREIRAQIFRSTALHEVGHTLGLRHNFQGTYDSLNYHTKYWELRTENLRRPQTMYDLYDLSALTENQIDGRMREYQYSSIMDYGYTFNTDIQGLGRYDRAAIIYGYTGGSVTRPTEAVGDCTGSDRHLDPDNPGQCLVREQGYVQVFSKRRGELGEAGDILTSTDELGFRFDDATTPLVPYLERWHYTTVMLSFPNINDAFDREWMRLEDYLAAQDDGAQAPVRVPYLFCSDEWVGAILSCQVYDAGADPFEMTRTLADNYRSYYYFSNFKRDRLGWDMFNALYSAFYWTFLPLSDYFQNWYLAPEGADEVMDNYYWLSINAGLNVIAEAMATPPYGTYCTSSNGNSLVNLTEEPGLSPDLTSEYYLNAYCDREAPFFEVEQGQGRRRFSAYDVDSGYNFPFLVLEAGHYWTTLAAFWALVDPEAYVLGTSADLGVFSISYYDFFPDEIHQLVNAVISEDFRGYSPVIEVTDSDGPNERGQLHFPVLSPVYDSDLGISFDPETGETVTERLGPRGAAICQPCSRGTDCNGYTGFLEGTYCQPLGDSGPTFCLQDCYEDASLCAEDETCNEFGNCVPVAGTCDGQVDPCDAAHAHGLCPQGQVCSDGSCIDEWPVVETDATFSLMDDMVWYGMFYTTFGYTTRYNDQLDVFKIGTDETIDPGPGFELVTFTDPVSGDTYGAIGEDCEADESELSPRCEFGLSQESGGVQLVRRGQELVERYNETLDAYWSDDGSDADREYAVFTQYSRAQFDLENHISKLNIIRAVYDFFGKVY